MTSPSRMPVGNRRPVGPPFVPPHPPPRKNKEGVPVRGPSEYDDGVVVALAHETLDRRSSFREHLGEKELRAGRHDGSQPRLPFALLDDLVRRDGRVARLQTHPALPVGGERTKRAVLGRDASPVLRAQSVQRAPPNRAAPGNRDENPSRAEARRAGSKRPRSPSRRDRAAAAETGSPSSAKPCTLPVTRSRASTAARGREK
jgi:hypothetical protein